jgi:tetratricopeptide (TPR) repeat protein
VPKIVDTSLSGETEVTLQPGGSTRRGLVPDLTTGTRVGRYVVLEKVGAGAMGAVYAAYDPDLDRRVAIKLLHVEHSGDDRATEARARMLREAQALARLNHPNVITVHDVGAFEDEEVFIAMELIRGHTIREWLEQPRTWREVVAVYRHAGSGLAFAHKADLVHRDFKPENVMLADDGRVLVMDFGLARHTLSGASTPDDTQPEISSSSDALSVDLTRTGALIGTPAFMAPELQLNESADARSDQFSFCVAFYLSLYGQRPFAGETLAALSYQVLSGRIRAAPKGSRVPAWVRRIVVRGLDKDPNERWPNMAELLDALARDPALARRRLGLAALALAVPISLYAGTQLAGGQTVACDDAAQRLAGVWDGDVAQKTDEAFAATGAVYAETSHARARTLLEAYAARWSEQYQQSCEASARGEQTARTTELRVRCLDDRRAELAALTETFTDADEKVVERAVSAVARLAPVEACADVDTLTENQEPEVDPAQAQEVARLRGELTRARTLLMAGRGQRAQPIAAEVEATAKDIGHVRSRTWALLLMGQIDADLGDHDSAAEHLTLAYHEAIASHDDKAALSAATRLVILEGDLRERLDAAKPWIDSGTAWIRRAKPTNDETAELHTAIGNALYVAGKFDEARPHFEDVLELRKQTVGPDDPRLAMAENALGGMLLAAGDPEGALPHLTAALEIKQAAFGPRHPEVAGGHNNIGIAHQFVGRLDDALPHIEKALEIRKATMPAGHPKIASTALNMAYIHSQTGNYAAALPYCQQALDGFEKTMGPDHPNTARALSNLGGILRGLDRDDEALEALLDAKQRLTRALGPDHADLANVNFDIAEHYIDAKTPGLAVPVARRAVAIHEAVQGPPIFLAEAQFMLARALLAQDTRDTEGHALVEAARETATQQSDDALLADIAGWEGDQEPKG